MATLDEERYLRYFWLLGEGGLFVLRRVVTREATNSGTTLDILLKTNRAMFHNILREQRQNLFPSSTKVNADVGTWDMSLLFLVLKRMFWSKISLTEKNSIETLKTCREHFQGHPIIMSMSTSDYATNRQLLEQVLRHISSGINANVDIEAIIRKTASGNINMRSDFQYTKEIGDLKVSVLCAMEEKFQQNFDPVQRKVEQMSRDITALNHMCLQSKIQDSTRRELGTILQAECGNEEKQKKAINLLFDFVKIIRTENTFTEEEIRENIRKRIEWYGYVCLDLIDDLMKWFGDFNGLQDIIIGYPQSGSIRIPIFYSSETGLLNIITYINGNECKQRLSSISSIINNILGFSCSLSWNVEPLDTQDTISSFCSPEKEEVKPEQIYFEGKVLVETSSYRAVTDSEARISEEFSGIEQPPLQMKRILDEYRNDVQTNKVNKNILLHL